MTTETTTVTQWSATVSANALHRLAPLLCSPDELSATRRRLHLHAFRIEPHPTEGGVILIATDGRTMGVAYDHTGHCTAPMTVYLPPDLIAACAPPPKPTLTDEDDEERATHHTLPGWMYPGSVHLTETRVRVFNSSQKKAGALYLWDKGSARPGIISPVFYGDNYVTWREALPKEGTTYGGGTYAVNPDRLSKFSRMVDHPFDPAACLYIPTDPAAPAIVRSGFDRRAFGLIMPMRTSGPGPDLPAWATATAPAAAGAEEGAGND